MAPSSSPSAAPSSVEEPSHYHSKSALQAGMSTAMAGAGAGAFVSAVQNSLSKHKQGAMGMFTRTGSTISFFTAAAGAYAFTDATVANAREQDGAINAAAGGCAAGFVMGAQGECERRSAASNMLL